MNAPIATIELREAHARVRDLAEFLWEQSPGHFDGALSKILVSTKSGAHNLDFRMSTYAPKAYVQSHLHDAKEQIYFFMEGEGLLELGEKREVVRAKQFVYIPPGLPHALFNTGTGNLTFLVITAPIA